MTTQTAKKATAGRKPMTEAQKKEAKRLDGIDYGSFGVEETEDLSVTKAKASNEMIPHVEKSLADGTGEGLERVGKTFAMYLPDEGIAGRVKNKLVSAAEHLNVGIKIAGPERIAKGAKLEDGTPHPKAGQWKVAFKALGKRKSYKRTTDASTSESAAG